uniref:Uncharacterized protein n=2 Tax=Oryza TaxID=4527 RepID=A0A0D3H1L9_9ORYZ
MADTGMDCGRRTGGPLHGNLQDVMNNFYPYDLLYDPCSDNPSSFFSICDDPFLSSFGDYEEPNGIGFRFPDWDRGYHRA